MKMTEADAKSWHMREAAHYNGGKVFFAYLRPVGLQNALRSPPRC